VNGRTARIRRRAPRLRPWAALALLTHAILGALAGALVGVVIVDYTDANASHEPIDLAVVAVCVVAGLAVAMLARGRPGTRCRDGAAARGRGTASR
jgi:peptidoglycan/LPS O-acetylase OafA/YrhL